MLDIIKGGSIQSIYNKEAKKPEQEINLEYIETIIQHINDFKTLELLNAKRLGNK